MSWIECKKTLACSPTNNGRNARLPTLEDASGHVLHAKPVNAAYLIERFASWPAARLQIRGRGTPCKRLCFLIFYVVRDNMSAEWGHEVKGRANGIGAEINARIRKAELL